ncbi:hypothetical protein JOF35_000093 [Streptomyces demainii]|uniref:Transposase IS204/IS1001/IS1096/IS1165 zinc-finger domain-containing protein n=1 Tax=Streptomyces demainii TaxID=588122 RepID=A0ABT9KHD7_9ACTN|nr:hypothetical protein [Streptomyces demainii]
MFVPPSALRSCAVAGQISRARGACRGVAGLPPRAGCDSNRSMTTVGRICSSSVPYCLQSILPIACFLARDQARDPNPQVRGGNGGSFQQGVSCHGEQDGRGCAVSRDRCASGARQRLFRRPGGGGDIHRSPGPVPGGLPEAGEACAQLVPTHLHERPLGSRRVVVRLRVRRYFCDRRSCSRGTFVEQVGGLTERHRRSSVGLTGWLRSIAVELGGRPAARLCTGCGWPRAEPACCGCRRRRRCRTAPRGYWGWTNLPSARAAPTAPCWSTSKPAGAWTCCPTARCGSASAPAALRRSTARWSRTSAMPYEARARREHKARRPAAGPSPSCREPGVVWARQGLDSSRSGGCGCRRCAPPS